MFTVLTDRQRTLLTKNLSAIENAAATVRGILDAAGSPASPAVEGKKKSGRPRKAKAAKSSDSSAAPDLTA